MVTKHIPSSERIAEEVIWYAPEGAHKCPVQIMLDTELSHFNQQASQDRHYHKLATEIYMVLEGTMLIEVDGQDYSLAMGDMIVINPKTAHQVKPNEKEFLCRVIAVNSIGASDKIIK